MKKGLKIILIIIAIFFIFAGVLLTLYLINQSSVTASMKYDAGQTNVIIEMRNDKNGKISGENPITISGQNGSAVFTISDEEMATLMIRLVASQELSELAFIDKEVEEKGMEYIICHVFNDDGKATYFCYGIIEDSGIGFCSDGVGDIKIIESIMENTLFKTDNIGREFKMWLNEQLNSKL